MRSAPPNNRTAEQSTRNNMENVPMNVRIVEGIGRGRWHGNPRPFVEDLLDDVFRRMKTAFENRDLSDDLRWFAVSRCYG
jgi:hypothetical protein